MNRLFIFVPLFFLTGLLGLINIYFIFRRKLYLTIPWFTIYLSVLVLDVTLAIWLVPRSFVDMFYSWVNFFVAWMMQGWLVVLGSMAIIEAMRNALLDFAVVRKWGKNLLIVIGLTVLLVAIWTLPYGTEGSTEYLKSFHLALRSARMVQLAVIVAFFLFSSYLALTWRSCQFGILLGFGFYVAVSLSCEAYHTQMGTAVAWKTTVVDMVAYLLTMLLWLSYILRTEPKSPTLPPSATQDLENWRNALGDLDGGGMPGRTI